jgi:predicted DCC family thiol-disulfide oxidoreductase YuxK
MFHPLYLFNTAMLKNTLEDQSVALQPMFKALIKFFPLLLFDSECILCNRYVHFIINRQKRPGFFFASLQSKMGRLILQNSGLQTSVDSMVLVTGLTGNLPLVRIKSDAVLFIAAQLKFPWSLLVVFKIVPRFILDRCYDLIAARRYKIWGRTESCTVPDLINRQPFINSGEDHDGIS